MTSKERRKIVDSICEYIVDRHFREHDLTVSDALTILSSVSAHIIRYMSSETKLDYNKMVTAFCNGMQVFLDDKRQYSTGDDDCDELLRKIVAEVNAGGDIGEIIDKYVDCDTPELRQEMVEGIERIRSAHGVDNVGIEYDNGSAVRPQAESGATQQVPNG